MLEELVMNDIQDKTRLLNEMNETRDAVNELAKRDKRLNLTVKRLEARLVKLEGRVENLMKAPKAMLKPESKIPTQKPVTPGYPK